MALGISIFDHPIMAEKPKEMLKIYLLEINQGRVL